MNFSIIMCSWSIDVFICSVITVKALSNWVICFPLCTVFLHLFILHYLFLSENTEYMKWRYGLCWPRLHWRRKCSGRGYWVGLPWASSYSSPVSGVSSSLPRFLLPALFSGLLMCLSILKTWENHMANALVSDLPPVLLSIWTSVSPGGIRTLFH